ncbi:MAG: hypothetical protein QM652_00485 [Legionella sp.]|uniref:hypothetical protein n=1 Tax=Legionella sp. TaxID=459 RepID=UPI0039E32DAA
MTNKLVRPDDILPDGVDSTIINGKMIRKGTIAAFLANVDLLEKKSTTEHHRQVAIKIMKELAPAVISIGLHKHVVFKNKQVEQILIDAEVITCNS